MAIPHFETREPVTLSWLVLSRYILLYTSPFSSTIFPWFPVVNTPHSTSGGTKFILLESFTKHLSRSACSSSFCVAGVGRSFGVWKCDRGTTAGFYGEKVFTRKNQTCSLWGAQQAQLLSYPCNITVICIYII